MEGIIEIHGEIGERVTLDSVKSQINPKATSHTVYLHSEGGDVHTGIEIYHLLNSLPNVTVVIEGLAASIATLIMQAGDKIVALKPSDIMIHNPFGQMQGEEKDMLDAAKQLKRVKSTIISVYKKRPKLASLSEEAIAAMMDKQTWMTADEAVAAGFIDEAVDKLRAVAKLDIKKFDMDAETKNTEAIKGALESIGAKLDAFFGKIKGLLPKNLVTETLASGEEITIQAEDGEDWAGKTAQINGELAAPGTYTLASGEVVVVGENGVVASVGEMPADNAKQLAEANKVIDDLKKQLEAKATEVAATNGVITEMGAVMKTLQAELKDLKNKIDTETFGDPNPAPVRPRNTKQNEAIEDPMAELGNAWLTSRN